MVSLYRMLRELMRLALDHHACLHACTGDLASTLIFALRSADTLDKGAIAVLRELNAAAARGATASLVAPDDAVLPPPPRAVLAPLPQNAQQSPIHLQRLMLGVLGRVVSCSEDCSSIVRVAAVRPLCRMLQRAALTTAVRQQGDVLLAHLLAAAQALPSDDALALCELAACGRDHAVSAQRVKGRRQLRPGRLDRGDGGGKSRVVVRGERVYVREVVAAVAALLSKLLVQHARGEHLRREQHVLLLLLDC